MKKFILLFILCEFAIVDIYTIDSSKKSISIEELNQKLRKLENKTESDTSLYDETSDIETNIIETTPTSEADDTSPSQNIYLLLGFGNYRYDRKYNYIFFYIYLRRYSGTNIKSINITIIIYYTNFRNLEENNPTKELNVTCPYNTVLKNVYQLNCSFTVEGNEDVNRIELKNNTFLFDGKLPDEQPILSPIGNKTMKNINKENDDQFEKFVDKTKTIKLFSLDYAIKEIDYSRNNFKVLNGLIKMQNIDNNSSIIRGTEDNTISGEYIFPFEDEFSNQKKNVSCTLNYVKSVTQDGMPFDVYDAECNPNGNLMTKINQAIGFSEKNPDIFVMFNATDDFVRLENNKTETTPTTIPSTDFIYLLLGFGNYIYTIDFNYISFYVYFRRYSGIKITVKVTFTIYVHYAYFRNLEEENIKEVNVTCPLVTEFKNVYQLNCSLPVDNENVNYIEAKNNTFCFDDEYHEPIYSPIGNKTMQNITKLVEAEDKDEFSKFVDPTRNIQLFSLDNSTKEIDYYNNKFRVLNGIRKRQNIEDEGEYIRGTEDNSLNGDYIFPFEDVKTNETKRVPCTLTYVNSITQNEMDYEVYDAECYPNGDLATYINQAIGYDKSGQKNDTFVMFNATEDYVEFTYYKGGMKYIKKKSSGLSGGAIAGIVVVCVVTLVIISLLILFIRRRRKVENEMNNDSTASALNTMNNITV